MANQKKRITIVGAGLTGSLLGLLLGRRGYEVDLYERRPPATGGDGDSGRSINLALSQRGIVALEMAGLMDDVHPLLIPMKGRMLHLEDGRRQFSAYGQRANEVIYSISRRDLNSLLVQEAVKAQGVDVHFQRKCKTIDFTRKKLTLTHEGDGSDETIEFEMLIGADGAGSQVRRCLVDHVGGDSESVFLDHDYKELEIPAGDAKGFRFEKNALHIWPRGQYMLIALPNLDGSFTVTLFLPKQGDPSFESLSGEAAVQKFFEDVFPTAQEEMPDLVEDFFDHPAGRLGTVRCHPWHAEDDGLVIGDAAHAIVPFHGQGMNCAFEDCSELLRLLDQFDDDWRQVAAIFSDSRKPNADAIAEMALENYTTMRATVTDPKYALKKEIGFELERRFPDQYIPRYSMVMFHTMPYAEALAAGQRQQEILDRLTDSVDSMVDVDWQLATKLVTASAR